MNTELDIIIKADEDYVNLEQGGVEAVCDNSITTIPQENFLEANLDSGLEDPPIVRKAGRPKGSPNKATELAPYHRKVRPVEDEQLLKDVFTSVYQHGVQTEGHIIAALRIPRYQWRNMINKPESKLRETIANAIDAYETKIKIQYAEVLNGESKWAMQFLSDEVKRINRKHGEADFLLQAAPSVYENMSTEDLEKLALDHVKE